MHEKKNRFVNIVYLLLLLKLIFCFHLFAQDLKDTTKPNTKNVGVTLSQTQAENKTDSLTNKTFGLLAYPYAFYSPETQLAFGGGGMIYFNMSPKKKIDLSKIVISAYYTTNKQYSLSVAPRIFFPGVRKFYLEGHLNYSKSVLEFYGLGNNSPEIDSSGYISKTFEADAQVTNFRIFKNIRTGISFEFASHKMADKKSNPNLFLPGIPGIDGGKISGVGLTILIDTRDNTSYPSAGLYSNFSLILFRKFYGSDYIFDKYIADIRNYWMPFESHIFAFQFFGQFSKGNTPFFSMPALGGSYKMRGYYEGRYRDKQYITAQAEYRKIIFWRIGAALFFSAGEVSPDFPSFTFKGIRHSYGLGLRFVFDPAERINLRADLGIAEKKLGIYFNLEEAF